MSAPLRPARTMRSPAVTASAWISPCAVSTPDAGAVLDDEVGDFAIFDNVDPEFVGGAGIAPGDRVVSRGAASRMPDAAIRQIALLKRLGHHGQALADLVGTPELGVDAVERAPWR